MIQIPILVKVALIYICGIIIGIYVPNIFPILICLLSAFFLLLSILVVFRKHSPIRPLIIYTSLLLFSVFYVKGYFQVTRSNIEEFGNKPVILTGLVVSEPESGKWQTNLIVKVDAVKLQGGEEVKPKNQRVLVRLRFEKKDILYSEKYRFSGVLRIPEDGDFKNYLERHKISATINVEDRKRIQYIGEGKANLLIQGALKIKKELINASRNYISPVYYPLLGGMMLKAEKIPIPIRDMFAKIGIAHILAISGQNVAIMAGIFLIIFRLCNIPKRISYSITFVLVILYAFIAGLEAPVVRAALMIDIFFLGYIIRRNTNIFITLAISSILILLWNPYSLFDVGFQLSFVTVLSIVLITPELERIFKLKPVWPIRIFLMSIAAWLGSLPLTAYYFKYISWVSPIINLIVIPLVTLILACGSILLFSMWILPSLSYFMGAMLNLLLFILLKISEIVSSWRFVYSEVNFFDLNIVLICYLLIFLFIYYPKFKQAIKGVKHVPQ